MLKQGEHQDNVPNRKCGAEDVTVVRQTQRAELSPSGPYLQPQASPPAMATTNKTRHPARTPATNLPLPPSTRAASSPSHGLRLDARASIGTPSRLPPPLQLLCRGKVARRRLHHHLGATSASLRKVSLPRHHGVAGTPCTCHPTTPPRHRREELPSRGASLGTAAAATYVLRASPADDLAASGHHQCGRLHIRARAPRGLATSSPAPARSRRHRALARLPLAVAHRSPSSSMRSTPPRTSEEPAAAPVGGSGCGDTGSAYTIAGSSLLGWRRHELPAPSVKVAAPA
jgi:hypothetical protein